MITFWISVIRGKGQGAKGQGNWQHYLVKDPDAPVYKDNLLRAGVLQQLSHLNQLNSTCLFGQTTTPCGGSIAIALR